MKLFSQIPDIVKIGIWGPPGSGKTAYVGTLRYDDCEGWKIKPSGQSTQDIYIRYSRMLRDELKFVPATIVGKIDYLNFDFEGEKSFLQNRKYRIVLPEAAGEYYEAPSDRPELLDEMSRYQGILWLVDPLRIDSSSGRTYRAMIQEWLFRFYDRQGGGTLKHYMAFCLTKMDLPKYAEYIDKPRDFCLDILGPDVEKDLLDYCDPSRINFFSTSSAGFTRNGKSNVDPADPKKLLGPAKPIHLFQPFSWLFSVI